MADEKQQRQKFDVERLIAEDYGLETTIDSMNPDGTVSLTLADGRKPKVNIHQMLKDDGVDPNSVDFILNSPGTAKEENGLSLSKQAGMIFAKTPKQQLGYLQREFGKENVVQDGDEFKIKDNDGFWKKANTAWYNEMAASSPLIAASIAGSIKGATLGTMAAGPVGAIAGGILGGAVSAGLAQYGEQKFAEMAGVRTEQDAIETASEVGRDMANNIIWDTATFGAGKALKAINPLNKLKIANSLGGLIHGTKPDDWMVAMRSADDANIVKKVADLDFKAMSSGVAQSELLPSSRAMASTFGKSIETAKKVAERQYDQGLEVLHKSGVMDYSHMPIDSVRNSLVDDLSKAGLMKIDDVGKPAFKNVYELKQEMVGVVDEKAQLRLKHLFNSVENIYKKQEAGVAGATALRNKPDINELLNLKRFIGQIQKDLGHFASASSVSDQPGRILSKTMSATDRIFNVGANHVTTKIGGKPAGEVFKGMNSKYSSFRTGYDAIASKAKDLDVKDLGSAQNLSKLVGKLDTEGGAQILQAYKTMADSIGSTDMIKRLTTLQQLKAGKSLASGYGGSGISGAIKSAVGLTGKGTGGVVTGASQSAHILGKNAGRALSPLVSVAKGNQFLKNLRKDERVNLFADNKLLSSFLQSITDFQPMQQQAEQELMSQVPQ